MQKTLIIRQIDNNGTLAVDVLQDGYNIIESTAYGATDIAQALLNHIEDKSPARAKEYTATHTGLQQIMGRYGNPEFGDAIIDEICQLFGFPLTPEGDA